MDFLKVITYIKRNQFLVFMFGIFLLSNSLRVFASNEKFYLKKNRTTYDLEQVYYQNSIPYHEYDNFSRQLQTFFGLKSDHSKTKHYQDIHIISDSESLREIYKSKLNDMIIDKYIYKLERINF